jgi:hypothetical protein
MGIFTKPRPPLRDELTAYDRIASNKACMDNAVDSRLLLASELRRRLWANPVEQGQLVVTIPLQQFLDIIYELER